MIKQTAQYNSYELLNGNLIIGVGVWNVAYELKSSYLLLLRAEKTKELKKGMQ